MKHVPPPAGSPDGVLQLLIANLDYSDYLGRLAIGRIFSGTVKVGDEVVIAKRDGSMQPTKITKLYSFDGLKRVEVDERALRRDRGARRRRGHRHRRDRDLRREPGAAAAAAHRRADDLHDLLGQHLALRRPRGQVGHVAQPPGPAGEGAADQRLDPRRAGRRRRLLQGAGPRRAAARHPDRDDAARGLRAADLEARGPHPDGGRRAQGAARAAS